MTGYGADGDALELVLSKLDGVRSRHGYWMARCPAHDDSEASLSVKRGTEQPVLLHCFAECGRDAILDAIGLTLADISKPREEARGGEWTPFGEAVAVYDYTDEHGRLLYQVLRTAGKQFSQRRPEPSRKSGWAWSTKGVHRVPYRLPQLVNAVSDGQRVFVVEGERDVRAVEAAGGAATTNAMGAGMWLDDYDGWFTGAEVVIVADKDKPGREHAADVTAHLRKIARSVTVVEAAEGKDAADHLAAGYGLGDFRPAQPETDTPDKPVSENTATLTSDNDTSDGSDSGVTNQFMDL